MGGKRIGSLNTRVEQESCMGRGDQMDQVKQRRNTSWRITQRETVLVGLESPEKAGTQQGGQLPKVLNLKKSSKHLKWTHLEQVQHCTNLLLRVTLPEHSERRKIGPELGKTLPLMKIREVRENSRAISKAVCCSSAVV